MAGVDRRPIEVRQFVSEELDDVADGDPYHPAVTLLLQYREEE
jgi:hypothetical protein